MALQLNKELSSGLEIPNAYYRIASIDFTKISFCITLKIYASQQAANEGKDPVGLEFVNCENDQSSITKYVVGTGAESNDIISRGYHYLKTKIPRFQTAVDI